MSGLVDRFVCRREGHIPSLTITSVGGTSITGFVCTCVRCGRLVEFTLAECMAASAANGETP